MQRLLSFLMYVGLMTAFMNCSKKEAEIPPTPELLESSVWQVSQQTYIRDGKDFDPDPRDYTLYPPLTDCDEALKWTFTKGIISIDYSANVCRTRDTKILIYNKERYSMTNGVLTVQFVGYQPEKWRIAFSKNDMTWSDVSGNGRRYYFTKL